MMCSSRRRVTAGLLLSFLTLAPQTLASTVLELPLKAPTPEPGTHTFTLRQIFHRGTYQDPDLHRRLDVHPQTDFVQAYDEEAPEAALPPRLTARSRPVQIERLADRSHARIEEHLDYASLTGSPRLLAASDWTRDEIPGPNVTDKETVINLAIMAANAYVPKYGEGEWENVSQGFNKSVSFGWEGDGLRGHIFADEGNKTIIVALKGTSPAVFDGDGTTTSDKLNDNLFFSCCCAQGGQYFWRQACDCLSGTYSCNQTCLIKALRQKTRYYSAAMELYTNVTELYPDSNMWIVGHSLGGAVSALLGLTYGVPVVTYEAPGDDLAARRLGLPAPRHVDPYHPHQRALTGAHHFGHTADPIFMGSCNGATSPCSLGGYAMESQCHTGTQCVYDTVKDKGWRVGLGYHRIHDVIDNVIRKYDKVPECVADSECVDCYKWKFFESNGSDSTTATRTMTSTVTTKTRTATCETPGWWGCLDQTTTTSSIPVITTTYTTTTCLTPGWFGCKVEANTTVTTTTKLKSTTSVTTTTTTSSTTTSDDDTCETPGFFGGCYDEPSTSRTKSRQRPHHPTATKTSTETRTETTSCETPGFFWGCYDRTTTHSHKHSKSQTEKTSITSPPLTTHTTIGMPDGPTEPSITTTPPTATTKPSTSQTASPTGKNPRRKCKHPAFFGLICLDSADDSDRDDYDDVDVDVDANVAAWQAQLEL